MKITLYGDSILKGVVMKNGRYHIDSSWEKTFAEKTSSDINNRARFGNTIQRALPGIEKDCLEKAESGISVIEFGGNDCDYKWKEIEKDPSGMHYSNTPPQLFEKLYRKTVRMLRESGRETVILNLPPIDSERFFHHVCRDGLNEDRVLDWLGDMDAIYRWQEMYSWMVERIAKAENIECIDIRSSFIGENGVKRELLCEDGIHPSPAGQKTICDALLAAV